MQACLQPLFAILHTATTEVGAAYGLEKLGTEKLHPIVARGILIDLAAVLGDMNKGQVATMKDVRAAPQKRCASCVHTYLQTRHGIVNQENLALKQLADAGVYVFAYIYSPVPIAGATGSIGSPIALR